MTAAQIEFRFDNIYERFASLGAPGYPTDAKSDFLTQAMETAIKQRYNWKANPNKTGFEETEKRRRDLASLVKFKTYTTFGAGFLPNSYTVQLPDTLVTNPTDYSDVAWFITYEACTINKVCSPNFLVKEVTYQELNNLLIDPFNKPAADRWIFRTDYENRIVALVTDGTFAPVSYTINYIRKPQPVDLQNNIGFPDINDELQAEIIEKAVTLASESIGDSRWQLFKQESLTAE